MGEREVSRLLKQYRDTINELRDLGVIRSSRVIPDYGEFVACKRLGLKIAKNCVNKGFDAIDDLGKKYEVKTRKATAWNKPTKFPVRLEQLKNADFLVYVEFDDDWNLKMILKIPTSQVRNNKHDRVVVTKELIQKYRVC